MAELKLTILYYFIIDHIDLKCNVYSALFTSHSIPIAVVPKNGGSSLRHSVNPVITSCISTSYSLAKTKLSW